MATKIMERIPWTSFQRASQRRDQFPHFQHHQSVAHQRYSQILLFPCLSQQVENLGQDRGILQELLVSPDNKGKLGLYCN